MERISRASWILQTKQGLSILVKPCLVRYGWLMDPRDNPYTPNAGARPAALVGRDEEIAAFDLLLARLQNGHTEQSQIVVGLRGVGKTVLLNEFRERAEERKWVAIDIEVAKNDDDDFRRLITREARTALFALSPREKWGERANRAASVLRSFSLSTDPDGRLTAGFHVAAATGAADSGSLDSDLTSVVLALGEAARERGLGVVLILDELQFLSTRQFEALIVAIHKSVQRALPITMVGAGLPQMPELAGEAKSYSERLFIFPRVGALELSTDARAALELPAQARGVSFEATAVDAIMDFTNGYPYFIQEFGKLIWNKAQVTPITKELAEQTAVLVEAKLDTSFFRVRLERTTPLESAYLRAMASLGTESAKASEVAALLHRSTEQCGPIRARLIEKGLLYTTSHGMVSFTVPQFGAFMIRNGPLDVPPKRARR